nr:hypothetical protein [Candidatus Sigynarchaeota archaeon]
MSQRAHSWRVLLSQIEEAAINLNQNFKFLKLELKKVDEARGIAWINFTSKDGTKRGLQIASKGRFPIDPPSIVLVTPDTFRSSPDVWPRMDHFFGPGRFDRFKEGFICVSVTWEYKDFKNATDWGLETDGSDKIRTLEAALLLIFRQANFV